MVEEAGDLLAGQTECVQFIQNAKCCGHNASCTHASDLQEKNEYIRTVLHSFNFVQYIILSLTLPRCLKFFFTVST